MPIRILSTEETNNYKLFFPFALAGLLGIFLWTYGGDPAFLRRWHPLLLTHTLLFPIVLGFLWTALPRFLASAFPGPIWKLSYLVLIVANFISFIFDSQNLYLATMSASYLGLLPWHVILMRNKKARPLAAIVLSFFALYAAALGSTIMFVFAYAHDPSFAGILGRMLQETGTQLHRSAYYILLIGAVGSRLIPALSAKRPPAKGSFSIHSLSFSNGYWFWIPVGFVLLVALSLPRSINPPLIATFRFAALFFIAHEIWFLFRPTGNRNFSVRFLQIAQIGILLSPWIEFIPGISRIGAAHVLFLSMLYLFVLVVAARVILAHGGHDLSRESRSPFFFTAYTLITICIPMRAGAEFFPHPLKVYPFIAGALLFAALLWLIEIVKTIMKTITKKDSSSG